VGVRRILIALATLSAFVALAAVASGHIGVFPL
jgi:hypothetical protein